jgi:hypothetical protein
VLRTCANSGLMLVLLFAAALPAQAARIPDVANTKHNLSVSGPGTVKAAVEDQVCVFCHTPHGASNFPGSPLWNRQLSNQTYTVYTSSSLDAEDIQGSLDQPGGSSKLCLSCHDGTLAIGTVNVLGGQQNVNITMTGTAADGTMPAGDGELTGYTRDLGTDLRNDHPISLNYDTNLANVDSELVDPVAAAHIGVRAPGFRPLVPLEDTGQGGAAQIQCASCHDPHLRDEDVNAIAKFLRLNRFQQAAPLGGTFDENIDIVCLSCHEKVGWNVSAHASPTVANETYTTAAAAQREFPAGTPVWQASCLNCHDTHSVHGTRRLLREGTDDIGTPKSGGAPALEETCYQCHSNTPVVTNTANEIKDIRTDFNLARHMPITNFDQAAGTEVHDIVDSDFTEDPNLLGRPLSNRHAECTDCHNPHRVLRNALFNDTGALQATHDHGNNHSNIASGALRGTWGVEPVYSQTEFLSLPVSYLEKKGDGGIGASTAVNSTWVTREYQICLKCHSDFGYFDNQVYPRGSRPDLTGISGGTPPNTNGLTQYTNQAMEFQAPAGHVGEPQGQTGSGAGSNFEGGNQFNHRSWHPVILPTGRTSGIRGTGAAAWEPPWRAAVGTQTMYCSDCHGSSTGAVTVVPTGNNPWGPHGSSNDFILKGTWDAQTGANAGANGLCFKCHDFTTYATENGENTPSGFNDEGNRGDGRSPNLHGFHAKRIGSNIQCMWCHTAVPHGWKNKALLVNLNDLGPEAGTQPFPEFAMNGNADVLNQEPYYFNAKLKVRNFAESGNWVDTDCGSVGTNIPGNNTQIGKDWMGAVCTNPP